MISQYSRCNVKKPGPRATLIDSINNKKIERMVGVSGISNVLTVTLCYDFRLTFLQTIQNKKKEYNRHLGSK